MKKDLILVGNKPHIRETLANEIDISSRVILMDDGNTKFINEPKELLSLGYLPSQSEMKLKIK